MLQSLTLQAADFRAPCCGVPVPPSWHAAGWLSISPPLSTTCYSVNRKANHDCSENDGRKSRCPADHPFAGSTLSLITFTSCMEVSDMTRVLTYQLPVGAFATSTLRMCGGAFKRHCHWDHKSPHSHGRLPYAVSHKIMPCLSYLSRFAAHASDRAWLDQPSYTIGHPTQHDSATLTLI